MIKSAFHLMQATLIYVVLVGLASSVSSIELRDETREIFHDGQYLGVVAAFGDFNSDKLTDIFCIQQGDKTLEILLSNETEPLFGQVKLNCSFKYVITGVIPGDYDGDSMMDVLVSLQIESAATINVAVLWGSLDSIDCNMNIVLNMSSQPFVIDYNDDMIPDIMGEDEDYNRCVWLSSKMKKFEKVILHKHGEVQKYLNMHSCAVLDVNNDLVSDLVVTGVDKIEVWIKEKQTYVPRQNIKYPQDAEWIGQSTFVDLNADGMVDHIMPICYDAKCSNSCVLWWDRKSAKWITLLNNFTFLTSSWGFINKIKERTALEAAIPPSTLRAGDFNLDGYPDFITVLENKSDSRKQKVVILENVACQHCPSQRTLKIHWKVNGLDEIENIQLATFFDLYENGIMDVIASSLTGNEWKTHILKNSGTYDAYFIKVLVLSGLCNQDCPGNNVPYGTNQPGPMIMLSTMKADGNLLSSSAVQMPQSAYFSLNLPYTVFGLGHTPNFVDHLTVGIPVIKSNATCRREWTQIIPNSQMVVIPYPPVNEKQWVNKLFLTPSGLVVRTCFALIGTCAFIAVLIGIFHWRERRQDKKEKMQNAFRFTF